MTLKYEVPKMGDTLYFEDLEFLAAVNGYEMNKLGRTYQHGATFIIFEQGGCLCMTFMLNSTEIKDKDNSLFVYKRVW